MVSGVRYPMRITPRTNAQARSIHSIAGLNPKVPRLEYSTPAIKAQERQQINNNSDILK
jgi:hypothetical protein